MIQYRTAIAHCALRRAKDAVKCSIRAHGLKPNHYSARELTVWAEVYLDDHRDELLAEAKTTVERWTAEGVFGKRAQRDLLKLKTFGQTEGALTTQPKPLSETHV